MANDTVTTVFYTFSGCGIERIVLHVDTFTVGSYNPVVAEDTIAEGNSDIYTDGHLQIVRLRRRPSMVVENNPEGDACTTAKLLLAAVMDSIRRCRTGA
jgi:hypothetical protein